MNNQLRTIRLYGRLGAEFGRVHRLAVASPAEAVRALMATKPGFEKFLMNAKDMGLGFAVFIGKRNLGEQELHTPAGDDIRIAPVILGAKSGWMQIILGVVIIVVSMVIDYFTFGAFGEATGYQTYYMGITMIIGGIIQLLMPAPKGVQSQDALNNLPSYVFNGSVNTTAQGYPVPLLYGKAYTGSAVLSAGIFATDNNVVPTTTSTTGGGLGSGGGGGGGNFGDQTNANL